MAIGRQAAPEQFPDWTFLTNHAHVLIFLWLRPSALLREVATAVGITERAVQRIIGELEEAQYLVREREGRRNRYQVRVEGPLRHPLERHRSVQALLEMVSLHGRRLPEEAQTPPREDEER
jgi:DNA-binding transcriptional ArsR family regulator